MCKRYLLRVPKVVVSLEICAEGEDVTRRATDSCRALHQSEDVQEVLRNEMVLFQEQHKS